MTIGAQARLGGQRGVHGLHPVHDLRAPRSCRRRARTASAGGASAGSPPTTPPTTPPGTPPSTPPGTPPSTPRSRLSSGLISVGTSIGATNFVSSRGRGAAGARGTGRAPAGGGGGGGGGGARSGGGTKNARTASPGAGRTSYQMSGSTMTAAMSTAVDDERQRQRRAPPLDQGGRLGQHQAREAEVPWRNRGADPNHRRRRCGWRRAFGRLRDLASRSSLPCPARNNNNRRARSWSAAKRPQLVDEAVWGGSDRQPAGKKCGRLRTTRFLRESSRDPPAPLFPGALPSRGTGLAQPRGRERAIAGGGLASRRAGEMTEAPRRMR